MDNLVSAHSIGNPVKYTYTSGIDNSIHFTIDHFVLSSELSGSINKLCVLDGMRTGLIMYIYNKNYLWLIRFETWNHWIKSLYTA